jgi:hypothetical protein
MMQRAESFVVLRRKPVKVSGGVGWGLVIVNLSSTTFSLLLFLIFNFWFFGFWWRLTLDALDFIGIRYIVFDHQFPFGDDVEA